METEKDYYYSKDGTRRRDAKNHKEWVANWRNNNKERFHSIVRKSHMKIKYNITQITYSKKLIEQDNKCKFCSIEFKDGVHVCVNMSKDRRKLLSLLCRTCFLRKNLKKIRANKKTKGITMNLETSIRKLIRNNDRRICDLATKLDNCDSDSEYEKLIE